MFIRIIKSLAIVVLCLEHCYLQDVPELRIIGGNEATPHSKPFQALLKFSGNDNDTWLCGGSLITENYILTSASCGYEASYVDIILGAHSIAYAEDTQMSFQSENIILHQNFANDVSGFVYENDIAVISLDKPVTMTDSIQVVQLPSGDETEETYVNKKGTISGWGQTDAYNSSSLSPVLLSQENIVISNEECAFVYYDLKSYDVCMQTSDDASPCFGDYGSPLMVDEVQAGIASQNVMYCIPGYPFLFTRVSSFLDWIKENTDYSGN